MKQWLFKLLKKWQCLPSTMIDSHELDFARTVGKRLDEHRELIEDIERATGYFSSQAGQWSAGHALTQPCYVFDDNKRWNGEGEVPQELQSLLDEGFDLADFLQSE